MASMSRTALESPMRMIAPLPNCRSIWLSAALSARFLFSSMGMRPPRRSGSTGMERATGGRSGSE